MTYQKNINLYEIPVFLIASFFRTDSERIFINIGLVSDSVSDKIQNAKYNIQHIKYKIEKYKI